MKRGIQNKASLTNLAIWYMKEYALERPDGDPIKTFNTEVNNERT